MRILLLPALVAARPVVTMPIARAFFRIAAQRILVASTATDWFG
ncbi:hypothetical protein ACFQU2_10635 [Siccirubricoccus deserti]